MFSGTYCICVVTGGLLLVGLSEAKLKLVYCIIAPRCVLNIRRVDYTWLKNSILEFGMFFLGFRMFKAPIN